MCARVYVCVRACLLLLPHTSTSTNHSEDSFVRDCSLSRPFGRIAHQCFTQPMQETLPSAIAAFHGHSHKSDRASPKPLSHLVKGSIATDVGALHPSRTCILSGFHKGSSGDEFCAGCGETISSRAQAEERSSSWVGRGEGSDCRVAQSGLLQCCTSRQELNITLA